MDVRLIELVWRHDGAGCSSPEEQRTGDKVRGVKGGQGEGDGVVEGHVRADAYQSQKDTEDRGGKNRDDGDFGSSVDLASG